MKVNTKQRKKARKGFEQVFGKEELLNRMFRIIQTGKQGLDVFIPLKTYTTLKAPGSFSEELLTKVLRGISLQRYNETVNRSSSCLWGLTRHPVRPYSRGYNTEAQGV